MGKRIFSSVLKREELIIYLGINISVNRVSVFMSYPDDRAWEIYLTSEFPTINQINTNK